MQNDFYSLGATWSEGVFLFLTFDLSFHILMFNFYIFRRLPPGYSQCPGATESAGQPEHCSPWPALA